ncbi:MAG: hypothetical protein KF757_03350 [Phycisphaeraceae bacterium]|nr:hypothetical protein [Phycisphaeraceae bacterium]MCW5763041.1 hypothetical protein [Phycisphaeraceae bacterium]
MNALKHGERSAELAELRRELTALRRCIREDLEHQWATLPQCSLSFEIDPQYDA